jgi:hypothetical protein
MNPEKSIGIMLSRNERRLRPHTEAGIGSPDGTEGERP